MPSGFRSIAFTAAVRAAQRAAAVTAQEQPPQHARDRLGSRERQLIESRDSFFLATVTADGWPYVQHRGGPPGFLAVLDEQRLRFPDYGGNRQFVTVGNLADTPRVALLLLDYPTRTRLKLFGEARVRRATAADFPMSRPTDPVAERTFEITVRGFDWNCPQHITPRFTELELEHLVAPLQARVRELESRLARLAPADPPVGGV